MAVHDPRNPTGRHVLGIYPLGDCPVLSGKSAVWPGLYGFLAVDKTYDIHLDYTLVPLARRNAKLFLLRYSLTLAARTIFRLPTLTVGKSPLTCRVWTQ